MQLLHCLRRAPFLHHSASSSSVSGFSSLHLWHLFVVPTCSCKAAAWVGHARTLLPHVLHCIAVALLFCLQPVRLLFAKPPDASNKSFNDVALYAVWQNCVPSYSLHSFFTVPLIGWSCPAGDLFAQRNLNGTQGFTTWTLAGSILISVCPDDCVSGAWVAPVSSP